MTEVHRVTATPVHRASFHGDSVVALVGCNNTSNSTAAGTQATRLLLYATSGVALADLRLDDSDSGSEGLGNVCCTSASAAGIVAGCAKRGRGRSQRIVVFFAAGSEVLACSEAPHHGDSAHHSIVCRRVARRDVALFSVGSGQLFAATRSGAACDVSVLVDFGASRIQRVECGRSPHEVIVLREDDAVAIVYIDMHNNKGNEARDTSHGISGEVRFHLPMSSTAKPVRAVFAGSSVLWVLCSDKTLSGFWFSPAADGDDEAPPPVRIVEEQLRLSGPVAKRDDAADEEEEQSEEDGEEEGENGDDRLLLAGEARSCGVHVARRGTRAIRFGGLAMQSGPTPLHPPAPIGWTHSTFIWSGHLHDFALRHCAYTLLAQNERGASPLTVHALRQNQSVLLFSPSDHHALSHRIVFAAPDALPALRAACESRVSAIERAGAHAADLCAVDRALADVLSVQHSLMAALHRERELIADVPAHQSVSLQLIRRLHAAFLRLSVARLLLRTGARGLDAPLREALSLDERRRCAAAAHAALHGEVDAALGVPGGLGHCVGDDAAARGPPLGAAVLLRHSGAAEAQSLRDAAARLVAMRPAFALLVLYCTFLNGSEHDEWDGEREEFLLAFCLPRSLARWAQLAVFADYHAPPPRAALGLAGDCAPIADLFAAIVGGLTAGRAYDAVFQLAGPALVTCGSRDMDVRVAVELLFLAYARGNAPVVEALFCHARGTAWRPIAARALALAALRSESVKLLSGLVLPRSPEEEIVERVFRKCPDGPRADLLLLDFYVLMQRYADGLRVCERMATRSPLDAQRAQVVASHLRSLMPNGNGAFRLRADDASPFTDSNHHNSSHNSHYKNRSARLAAEGARGHCGPLRDGTELDEAVARAAMRITARSTDERPLRAATATGSAASEGNAGPLFVPTPAAALVATREVQQQQQQQQRKQQSQTERQEEAEVTMEVPLIHTGAPPCEAIIKRSGKPCGRRRPCEYHDRAR